MSSGISPQLVNLLLNTKLDAKFSWLCPFKAFLNLQRWVVSTLHKCLPALVRLVSLFVLMVLTTTLRTIFTVHWSKLNTSIKCVSWSGLHFLHCNCNYSVHILQIVPPSSPLIPIAINSCITPEKFLYSVRIRRVADPDDICSRPDPDMFINWKEVH
jgi:hypothetical protein